MDALNCVMENNKRMQETTPCLVSVHPLPEEFRHLQRIVINLDEVTIGRARTNTILILYLSISRQHCAIRKIQNEWFIEDQSTYGIEINTVRLGRGNQQKLKNGDVLLFEPSRAFIYTYYEEFYGSPACKRLKLENSTNNDFINNMKSRFEESQTNAMGHIADKIYTIQQRHAATLQYRDLVQKVYDYKTRDIENHFALLIQRLNGEEQVVQRKKIEIEEERDSQLAIVQQDLEDTLNDLMDRIRQLSVAEFDLHEENKLLKERLLKEREEFLLELSRENYVKEEFMHNLEAKIREQDEIRLREKHELEMQLKFEMQHVTIMKENELKELAEQKIRREEELLQELSYVKQNLEGQVEQMEIQRCQTEERLIYQMKEMTRTNEEDKEKIRQLILERQNIENKLCEVQRKYDMELSKLKSQVNQKEVELTVQAAERLELEKEQSSEMIKSLQAQLKSVKNQLESVENEKKQLLSNKTNKDASPAKMSALAEVGELMENELQCSICSELFVDATTLNCSHTFCKTCITLWTKKKKECPICRAKIISECKSLVLDSFIDKMVQNLSEEVKQRRAELVKARQGVPTSAAREIPTVDLTGVPSNSHSEYPPLDPPLGANIWGLNGGIQ
ncbi:uncharacterized protein [Epargyreus clarus]|uniref:uncharacterized protein isoform X2 n=1 Tax=Epargyreus clarus TaxID=520877 RepID=UPI003C2FC257